MILFLLCFHSLKASNTLLYPIDSTAKTQTNDTIYIGDSLKIVPNTKKLKNRINYQASDSISFDIDNKVIYLFNRGNVKQKDIELTSGIIRINFDSDILNAMPFYDAKEDSTGQYPLFSDHGTKYKSKELTYNIDNGKGIIRSMFTNQQEGYLHGEKIKKINDSTLYVSGGTFTTCSDEDNPHFGINFSKAEIVTDDKIITGPAWFSIMGIPLPLGIPFAYFPFTDKQKSGLLMPTYGYASNRGYYLRNLGWYFAFNDYIDLALQGDIYTNLSYAINAKSNYVKRYKYKGNVLVRFEENHSGLKNTDTWTSGQDFKFQWQHAQDSKAHPYKTFSANVNLVSAKYNQYTTSLSDYLTNTTTSSIAFSTRFGSDWNFSVNLGENYNINTNYISLDLPSATLSSSQFHPLKRKKTKGKQKWYEDITVTYRMNLVNSISTYDSLLFKKDVFKQMRNGIQHYIPIQSSTKIFKYLNWTNSINYTERWYLSSTHKAYNEQTGLIDKDTNFGFTANRDVNFSSSVNTRIYGMFVFKKGYVKALRHVFNPALSFTFTPDFSSPSLGFYDYYIDANGKKIYYSKTEDGAFGSPPSSRSGVVNFTLNNSLEMKVKSSSDTVSGTQKIVLLENFSVSSGYDLAKDSCNWQPLRISARTTILKKLIVNYSASFTPYVLDENNRIVNRLLWNEQHKLFTRQSSQWNLSLSWHINSKNKNASASPADNISPAEMMYSPFVNNLETLPQTVDFSVPWDITLTGNYSLLSNYVVALAGYSTNKSATLSATGNVNVTDNWKIGYRTGYDFINKDFTYTSIDFYRDLHCWEMRFNWVPFGLRTGWNFTISVKASMLQDLKYEKRNDFRNRMDYY
ncbi:MAG: LPS-assembly protein LptD [Bacteroidales bacterium]|nr:LPS-assembly protein LptD [Bacteroidales bacterium]